MIKTLKIDIVSYWHAGTGRTSGSHVDSLVEKDAMGLPFLNGRHNKGLIRDAIQRAQAWGWFNELDELDTQGLSLTDWLFGTRHTDPNKQEDTRFNTTPGVLAISNATLSDDERHTIYELQLAPSLYRHLFSTAIEHATGTAKEHSLRGIEVAIPMMLSGEVECRDEQQAAQVFQHLELALSLIDHVGGMRNRGLGRAQLSLAEQGGNAA